MKIQCRISGMEFFSSEHFKEDKGKVFDLHPIFRIPTRSLLAKAVSYGRGKYSREEERLLFLALLNATEAVEWEVPGRPNEQTVGKNLTALFKLLGWYEKVSLGSFMKLPHFRVSEQNANLDNVAHFIDAWYDVRKEWMLPQFMRSHEEELETREFLLHKLIHSGTRNTESFSGRLGSWAIDKAQVPEEKKEEWLKIFRAKDDEVYSLPLQELEAMQEWMKKELYRVGGGTIFSAKVLEHLDKLVKVRKGGRLYDLGGEKLQAKNAFTIKHWTDQTDIATEKEVLEKKLLEMQVPEKQPRKEDYPGKLSTYVRALITWRKSEGMKQELAEIAEQEKHQAFINRKGF